MRERPILFSGEMVRAILDGRKSVTRRVVKFNAAGRVKEPGSHRNWHRDDPDAVKACPYGQPGDRLWVREAWAPLESVIVGHQRIHKCAYRATNGGNMVEFSPGCDYLVRWKPSIHMPRWASRLTLEVVGVRVERVQEIGDEDAVKEGCKGFVMPMEPDQGSTDGQSPAEEFRDLWDHINASRGFGWDKNPWVWVVEFKRREAKNG